MNAEEAVRLKLIYSLRDFQLALSALDFLLEVDEEATYSKIELRRFRCYLETAATAYWRPFATANGLRALTFEQLGVVPTVAEIELHNRLRVFRNKVVAHSDPERMRVLLTSTKPFGDHAVQLPIFRFDEGLDFLPERDVWVSWLRTLIHAVARWVFDEVQGRESYMFERDYVARPK